MKNKIDTERPLVVKTRGILVRIKAAIGILFFGGFTILPPLKWEQEIKKK